MQLSDLDVMIVDDHEAMRALLARVFTKVGVANLRAVADAAAALASLRERPASLILADKNIDAIGQRIHIDFNCINKIAVNQHRIVARYTNRFAHIGQQLATIMSDFHRPPA